ncbi:hypothetical protein DFH07DRAFT_947683, partial [Mycena maculata]
TRRPTPSPSPTRYGWSRRQTGQQGHQRGQKSSQRRGESDGSNIGEGLKASQLGVESYSSTYGWLKILTVSLAVLFSLPSAYSGSDLLIVTNAPVLKTYARPFGCVPCSHPTPTLYALGRGHPTSSVLSLHSSSSVGWAGFSCEEPGAQSLHQTRKIQENRRATTFGWVTLLPQRAFGRKSCH